MTHKKENSAPLPGVWRTIAAGFDLTSKHLWLLILPVVLDTFLWLGPRLSGRLLIERLVALLPSDQAVADLSAQLLALAPRTNLFTSLSIPLLGVPALMVGATPQKTPLPTQIVEMDSAGLWLGLFLLFTLVGALLTAVYFTLIAREVGAEDGRAAWLAPGPGQAIRLWTRLLLLGLVLLASGFLIYLLLLPVSLLLSFVSAGLATIIFFMGPVLLMWLVIYLFFAPHGLALHGRSLYQAATESLRIVRVYVFSVLGLILTLFIIRNLASTLFLLADDGSWLTLFSILGHAFISTSLTTATFIFYRDRYQLLYTEAHPLPQA